MLFNMVIFGSAVYSAPLYPEPIGNVNDYVGKLTQSDKDNLDALVDSVLEQTGVVFAVAVVDSHEASL